MLDSSNRSNSANSKAFGFRVLACFEATWYRFFIYFSSTFITFSQLCIFSSIVVE